MYSITLEVCDRQDHNPDLCISSPVLLPQYQFSPGCQRVPKINEANKDLTQEVLANSRKTVKLNTLETNMVFSTEEGLGIKISLGKDANLCICDIHKETMLNAREFHKLGI